MSQADDSIVALRPEPLAAESRSADSISARSAKLYAMIRMSLRSLLLHKLRSFLTILGLVFGVASVIIMLAIAEGALSVASNQPTKIVSNKPATGRLNTA